MRLCVTFCAILPSLSGYSLPRPTTASWTAQRCTRRAAAPVAKTREFTFVKDDERITFGAKQKSITLIRPEAEGTFYEFVTNNAENIVLSSWPRDQVQQNEDGTFTIKVEEFEFLSLKVGVLLRARVWLDERTSTAHLKSCGFEISGLESVARTDAFEIAVAGWMRPSPPQSSLCALTGNIEFTAKGDMPWILQSTPEGALRAATGVISNSLIGAASTRFDKRVPDAYHKWAEERRSSPIARR